MSGTTVRVDSHEEMSVYYVGKPQDSLDEAEISVTPPAAVSVPSAYAVTTPGVTAGTTTGTTSSRPAIRSYPGTTTRPYEVSSRVFSTAQTAIVLIVLVACIAGTILLLYSIDDRWKPDWKNMAYCDFDSLIQDRCPSESIDRVSAIIQHEADGRFRHFNGDTNYSALQLASSYFRHCCHLYLENNSTYDQIVAKAFAKNLSTIDVITLLSDQSPLFPVDIWQAVPCENSTCTLWKCEPLVAHGTLLSASNFLKRMAVLNSSLIEEHRREIHEVHQTLLDSLLAACAHSNDSTYELFEEDPRYAIASASFNALEPFRSERKSEQQRFVADILIGLVRPRSVELARDFFPTDKGESECLESTKQIFGNITYLPYVDEQSERFIEAMEQVMPGKRLIKYFGKQNGNMSRIILGLNDVRLTEIDQLNISGLKSFEGNRTFIEFASYEQLLDTIYRGNRHLKTALVEKQYTEEGKLVVPLILAKLLDIADTPVKDSLAQLLLRNAGQDLVITDDEYSLSESAL